ncbi:MAG: HAD family phosphatase [Nanoarchaeota archaeon]|nr:HAD family phosphatase [Nanoarchaeota archaeon]
METQKNSKNISINFRNLISYNIKGVLLDFDGTVVNSENSRYLSIKKILEVEYSIYFTEDEWKNTYKSLGTELIFKLILEKNNIKIIDNLPNMLYEKSKIIRTQIEEEEEVEIIEGFLEFYEQCNILGLKCIICSGGTSEHVQRILKKANLQIQGFGRDEYNNRKPAPDAWLKGLELLKLDKHEVLLFDDAKTGIVAGLRAGIKKCCAIDYDVEDFKDIQKDEQEIGIKTFKYFNNWKEVNLEELIKN